MGKISASRRRWPRAGAAAFLTLAVVAGCGGADAPRHTTAAVPERAVGLTLEPGSGSARLIARGQQGMLGLRDRGPAFAITRGRRSALVTLDLPVARRPHPERRLPGVVHDLRGRRDAWRTNLPTYGAARYKRPWRGVDLLVHGDSGAVEYDFLVAPGADPADIGVRIRGGRPSLTDDGRLVVRTAVGRIVQRPPVLFQRDDRGRRTPVEGRFALRDGVMGFDVGAYDRRRTLVIDPVVEWATYAGGSQIDAAHAVSALADGSVVATGSTLSSDFPTTPGAYDTTNAGNSDVWVTKLAADGQTRTWSTFLGGTGSDQVADVEDGGSGAVLLGGQTTSTDFPATGTAPGGGDGWVARLTSAGSLDFAHWVGGTSADEVSGVIGSGSGYVAAGTTSSSNIPLGASGYDQTKAAGTDGFLVRHDGTSLLQGTFLGGSGDDAIEGIARDVQTRVAVVGTTDSTDLPTIETSGQPDSGGGTDAFAAQVFPDLANLGWITYHGGAGTDVGEDIASVDNFTYIVGATSSSDLPLVQAADSTLGGFDDGFLATLDEGTGERHASTYVGSDVYDIAFGVATSRTNVLSRVWVVGSTDADGDSDAAIWRFANDGRELLDRVELEGADSQSENAFGVDVAADNDALVVGNTGSTTFPTTAGVVQPSKSAVADGFVARLVDDEPADVDPPQTTIVSGPSGPVRGGFHHFTFTADEPATFTCHNGGDGPAYACESPVLAGPFGLGSHQFSVVATDTAGNSDDSPATRTFTVYSFGPQPDTQIDSGPTGTIGDDDATFTFSANPAEAGVTFQCRVDTAVEWSACTSPRQLTGLAEGAHTFRVRAVDSQGIADSSEATRSFTVDTTPPDTQLLNPPSGKVRGAQQVFEFVSEPGATFTCQIDSLTAQPCTSPWTAPPLSGVHVLRVVARDAVGNADSLTPASTMFDVYAPRKELPETVITSGPSGDIAPSLPSFGFAAEPAEAGVSFECSFDGSVFRPCASPYQVESLGVGEHTFRVRLVDGNGLVDETPAERSIRLVGPPPPSPPAEPAVTPTLRLGGPTRVGQGAPVRFSAVATPERAGRHEWDLDGDGTFERSTGDAPTVDHAFPAAGLTRIRLRATLETGRALEAELAVTVDPALTTGLTMSRAYPTAGDSVRFEVSSNAPGAGTLYGWRFPGLEAADEDVALPRARSAALRGGTARMAAVSSPQASDTAPVLELDGVQPTTQPTLTRELSKSGVQTVDLRQITPDGRRVRTVVDVGVRPASRTGDFDPPAAIDCDSGKYEGPCAGISYTEPATTTGITYFTALLPTPEICLPSNFRMTNAVNTKLARVKAKFDLVNPAEHVGNAGQIAAGRRSGRARAAQLERNDCIGDTGSVLQWTINGTRKVPETPGDGPPIVGHQFTSPGTATIRLVARVPFLKACTANCQGPTPAQKFYDIEFATVTKTITVEIVKPVCNVSINTIPLGSSPGPGVLDRNLNNCFYSVKSLDSKKVLLHPFPGYGVSLGGLYIAPVANAASPAPLLIDLQAGTISNPNLMFATATPADPRIDFSTRLEFGFQLTVPKPSYDDQLKRSVVRFDVNPNQFLGEIGGLRVADMDIILSSSHDLALRLAMDVPEPIVGGTPPLLLGGAAKVKGASTTAEDADTDFEIDLSDMDLGFMQIKSFMLKHRRVGGWLGGGRLVIPTLGNTEIVADYKRPETVSDNRCRLPRPEPDDVPGPSGISLRPDGSFEFGGISIRSALLDFGSFSLPCVRFAGTADPLMLQGSVEAHVPGGGVRPVPVKIDGCIGLSVLEKDDPATLCKKKFVAEQNLTWFYAGADITLMEILPLGGGYFDLRKGPNLTEIGFGAKVDVDVFDLGIIELMGSIDGVFVLEPKKAFEVLGQIGICGSIIDAVNAAIEVGTLGLADPPDCYRGQAILSSKGGGVCIKDFIGGNIYWDPKDVEIITGCDLTQDKSLRIDRPSEQRSAPAAMAVRPASIRSQRPARIAQLGGATSRQVRVPAGKAKVAFDIRGASGPPAVEITGPGGRKILDGGVTRTRTHSIAHVPGNRTIVTVMKPAAGVWTIAAKPGTTPISAVGLSLPIAEPRVLARVAGKGAKRRLVYRATLAKGDRLTFNETGTTVGRSLGRGRNGAGRISFKGLPDSPGRRRIVASIERNGLPYKSFTVARYSVPRPPAPKPPRVELVRRGTTVTGTWARDPRAVAYEATVTIGTRVDTIRTRSPRVRLTRVSPFDRVIVKVVATSAAMLESRPGTKRLAPRKQTRARLRL